MTQTGGQTIGAQICGLILHGNKRHDSWHRRNLLKNSPTKRTEAAFQCKEDSRCASCQLVTRDSKMNKMKETHIVRQFENWNEQCVQNEISDGHKIELTDGHGSGNN